MGAAAGLEDAEVLEPGVGVEPGANGLGAPAPAVGVAAGTWVDGPPGAGALAPPEQPAANVTSATRTAPATSDFARTALTA